MYRHKLCRQHSVEGVQEPKDTYPQSIQVQEYGETTEQQKAIGAWLCDYAESRQPFDEIKHRHTLKEVGDVADGRYDWKIERMQGNGISK